MSESPIVSAILPIWNGAEYLEESINSVQTQTYTNWELLVIAEPDGVAGIKQIVPRYAADDCRIRWIENETHIGLAASLNQGIELARGKYIARIDVDDPSYPVRFEKQVQYLETHTKIDILGSQYKLIRPNFGETNNNHLPATHENIQASLLFWVYLSHPSLMLRREALTANGLCYPDAPAEDMALWLNCLDKMTFANLDEPLLNRRGGFGTNVTTIKGEKVVECAQKLISQAIQKYFHIDTDKYATNRFLYACHPPWKYVQITEFADWMTDSVYLLLEMERANSKYRVFNDIALARTLRKRWNWILDSSYILKFSNIIQYFSPLIEKSDNSFSTDLGDSLIKNGFTIRLSNSSDDILSIIRNIATNFMNHIVAIFKAIPKVLVFGIGYYCDKFLTEYPDIDYNFNLFGFCDNDQAKQGKIKHGRPVFTPNDIPHLEFDYILIATEDYYNQVHSQLIGIDIPTDKLLPLNIFRYKARP